MPECALISWVLAAMPADAQVNSRGICHLPQQQVHKEQLHFWPGEQKLRSAGFPSDCSFYFSLPSGSPPLGGVGLRGSSMMPLETASAIQHLQGSCLEREQSSAQQFLQAQALPAGAMVLAQQDGCPF